MIWHMNNGQKCNISTTLYCWICACVYVHQHGTFKNGIYCGHFPLTVSADILFCLSFPSSRFDVDIHIRPPWTQITSIVLALCVCVSVSPPHIFHFPIQSFQWNDAIAQSYVWWFHCNRSDERLVAKEWASQRANKQEQERELHDVWVPHYLFSKYYYICTHIKKSQKRVQCLVSVFFQTYYCCFLCVCHGFPYLHAHSHRHERTHKRTAVYAISPKHWCACSKKSFGKAQKTTLKLLRLWMCWKCFCGIRECAMWMSWCSIHLC